MGKNQSASNLVNIIQYNNGNISFVSGSTTLMQISSSGAITTTGVISGSNALSASYAATASFVTLAQTASFVTTAQTASFVTTAQTASFVTLAQTASFVANAQSASNAVAAQTASFANAFTVAGTLTAQTLVVQTVTSSIVYSSGSNIFGNSLANTQAFTGSVSVTGSLAVVTNGTELQVGATGVTLGNALTDIHNVTGSLRITGSLSGTSATFSSLTNGSILKAGASGIISNTSFITETGTGVGFQIASPLSLLHMNGQSGTAGLPSLLLYGEAPSNGQRYGLNVSADQLDVSALGTNGRIAFFTGGAANSITERARITSGGNVAIGNTGSAWNIGSPVLQMGTSGVHLFGAGTQGQFGSNAFYDGTNYKFIVSNWATRFIQNSVGGEMWFERSSASGTAGNNITFTTSMYISNGGFVGIGTTSPSQFVEIQKDQAATTTLLIRNVNDQANAATEIRLYGNEGISPLKNNQQISFVRGSGGVDWALGQPANSSDFVIAGGTNQGDGKPDLGTAERIRITSGGATGFATTPASQNGGTLAGSAEMAGILRIQGGGGRYFTSGDGLEISKTSIYSYNRGASTYNDLGINDSMTVKGAGQVKIGANTSSMPGALLSVGSAGYGAFGVICHGQGVGTWDSGITINQGNAGMAMLVLASIHTSDGTATQSALYLVNFYYSGNNTPAATHVAGNNFVTFGKSGSNTLTLTTSGIALVQYALIGNK